MKKYFFLIVLMFLPLMANASLNDNWDQAKQKMAPLYKYADRYIDKLKGDEGILFYNNISNPDSLADANMDADLNMYLQLGRQNQDAEISIPKEVYNPDIDVEVDTDVFYDKNNSFYYKVGSDSKSIVFDNETFSDIAQKYGSVGCNNFYYLAPSAPLISSFVEIKLQGNTRCDSDETGTERPAQVMSGKYDIYVIMVPYWYKTIAEGETAYANFLDLAYVDSISAISKMSFICQLTYNDNAAKGKDVTSKKTSTIEYDGKRVDTLMVFEDFEFPYSYKDLNYSYPTLRLQGATTVKMVKQQGFIMDLCIDRVIMKSKESDEEIVITPKAFASYTKDQMATIILPTEPDASKGKYYRLDRCEDRKIIFTEEAQPKAKVPYIIVPSEDFSIDLSTLDLEGLTQASVSVGGVSFIGSYSHAEYNCEEGYYIDIIDKTPDCHVDDVNLRKATIGALRAYLKVNWDDPYGQGPTKGVRDKLEIVLEDNPNSIAEVKSERVKSEKYDDDIYDLSGRRLSGKPAKGLYIQNGKKVMVK
ncbi:MAG: hypothetical protein IKO73_04110 [Bacteroidaceae bacterium]|nr:hypothetical protein [Bacteroidaceae bacterium]